jgi:hypothetical protein
MEVRTQDGYYVWEVAGKPVIVYLHLDVLDRLSSEVMRGFGAVPKRGAEVGGVLIGTVEEGSPAIVRVEDFESVECAYKRGPSYLFTDDEKAGFEDAVQRWQPDSSRSAYVVGFYRSQTRDGMSLAAEDIQLLDEFFPDAESVALLVKPYGTKVSEAGFFVRENGAFPDTSPQVFPFRRREITGESPPPHRAMTERRPRNRGSRAMVSEPAADPAEDISNYRDSFSEPSPGPAYATTLPTRSRFNSSAWIPLSFVFLLFGIALGYMISLASTRPPKAGSDAQDFALGLSVLKSDDNLTVKWDRQSGAIRAASNGMLEIEENGVTKPVSLDPAMLQTGSVIVQKPTHSVRFRLTVHPQPRLSVVETAEWRP